MTDKKLSRRQLLEGAAVGAAAIGGTALAASALGPKVASAATGAGSTRAVEAGASPAAPRAAVRAQPVVLTVPESWNYSADVVVVGYGSAGAVTAITAFDAGADVLILEKVPSQASLGIANNNTDQTAMGGGGGNSRSCGGGWYVLDPVAFASWHYHMSFGATPFETSQAFANMVAQNRAFYDSIGMSYINPGTAVSTTGEYASFGAIGGSQSISGPDNCTGNQYTYNYLITQIRGIPILYNTRGTALIQNPATREVLGVQALQNLSQVVNIQAKRAVVLTTGGFEFDSVMKLNYLKMAPYHFGGWQYNTGDGIKMAMAAGAGLWHMNTTSGRLSPWSPNHNTSWAQNHPNNAWVWVDRYGNRFCNESSMPGHSAWEVVVDWNFTYGEYSRVPTLLIFDSTTYSHGPVVSAEGPSISTAPAQPPYPGPYGTGYVQIGSNGYGTGSGPGYVPILGEGTPNNNYTPTNGTGINTYPVQYGGTGVLGGWTGSAVGVPWSKDNSVELAAGYLVGGADMPTLAANIAAWNIVGSNQGMDIPVGWNSTESMDTVTLPDQSYTGSAGTSCPHFSAANLQAAINQWNTDCAAGKGDTVYGRAASTMAPISTPPYYALPLWPSGPNTNGGPIRSAMGEVCDPYYNPIPRLYSAGELGSVWGFLYQGGGNITESIAYGRICGNNAASETPWTS